MRIRAQYPNAPASVGAARHFVNEALGGAAPTLREHAVLMVSELATNAVKHAHTGFSVVVHRAGGRIRIEVTDHGGGRPRQRHPAHSEPNGRGLLIVEAMSDEWGVDEHRDGKTVWFALRSQAVSPA